MHTGKINEQLIDVLSKESGDVFRMRVYRGRLSTRPNTLVLADTGLKKVSTL